MYKNVLRSMLPSHFRCSQMQLYRHLSDFRVNSIQNSMIRPNIDKEEEEALKIEANLFEQSSVQYKPVTAAEVILKKKINQKLLKPTPKHFPKPLPLMRSRTRLDRQADSQIINDAELGLEFIKLHLNDPRLNNLMISARSKKRRDKDYQIVIEGRRLIEEALDCGLHLQTVIFSQKDQLLDIKEAVALSQKSRQTKIYKVPQHDLKIWSSLSTPPGVLAIFERPSLVDTLKKFENASTALPITVVCDNIREPNNLGSIIRSCAALPCLQVVTTKGCCDPWESKSLRGGCGGHFRLAIRDNIDWNDVPLMIPPQVAHNIRVFIAENNMAKLPNTHAAIEYTDITDAGDHNVLIIGGETHGVSTDAYRFLKTFAGDKSKCVYIPLAAGIDSLNVASALTLILYELRRCILKHKTTLRPTTAEEENKINIL